MEETLRAQLRRWSGYSLKRAEASCEIIGLRSSEGGKVGFQFNIFFVSYLVVSFLLELQFLVFALR